MVNREIKFRAWDKKRKFMHKARDISRLRDLWYAGTIKSKWDELEIMQFTGLKDKNGKEIFEGDILIHNNGDKFLVFWNNNFLSYFVKNLRTEFENMLDLHKQDGLIVFGNKFENPELLEVQKR